MLPAQQMPTTHIYAAWRCCNCHTVYDSSHGLCPEDGHRPCLRCVFGDVLSNFDTHPPEDNFKVHETILERIEDHDSLIMKQELHSTAPYYPRLEWPGPVPQPPDTSASTTLPSTSHIAYTPTFEISSTIPASDSTPIQHRTIIH